MKGVLGEAAERREWREWTYLMHVVLRMES